MKPEREDRIREIIREEIDKAVKDGRIPKQVQQPWVFPPATPKPEPYKPNPWEYPQPQPRPYWEHPNGPWRNPVIC